VLLSVKRLLHNPFDNPMRIHITGACGSGTSTLGAALAAELGGTHMEADNYFWLATQPPYTARREPTERLTLLLSDLGASRTAILAGAVMGWGTELEDSFDLIVFLYLDGAVRVQRLETREVERFGRADPAFLRWAAQYDEGPSEGRSLAKHRAWLSTRRCPVVEIHGDLSVRERVAMVRKEIPELLVEPRPGGNL
jgi:hypothetical protein